MKSKTTEQIQGLIENNVELENVDFIDEHYLYENFLMHIIEKNNTNRSQVIKNLDFDYNNTYKRFNGKSKRFSRDMILKIFLFLEVDVKEVDKFLKTNDYPLLYVRKTRDRLIRIALINKQSVKELNDILVENNMLPKL